MHKAAEKKLAGLSTTRNNDQLMAFAQVH